MDKIYSYRAVNEFGEVIDATTEAENEAAIMAMLRNQGYRPISIEEKVQSKAFSFGNTRLVLKDIIVFSRQLSTMLRAGMDLNRCLDVLADQSESKKLRSSLLDISASVKKGTTLSKSMEQQGDAFPSLLKRSVESGEMSGQMAEIIEKMADHYERDMAVRRRIKGAMTYPIILLVVMVIAVTILLTKVMPNFVGMFESAGMEMPALTQMVMNLSDLLVKHGILVFLAIVAVVVGIQMLLRNHDARVAWDRTKIKMPVIGKYISKIVTARFTRTLSTMLYSGLPIVAALKAAGETTDNKYVEEMINRSVEGIEKGMSMTAELTRTGIFPPMMLSMVGIGEESGNLDDMLERTADYYDAEMQSAIDALVTMMEPLMVVLMGVVIGTIVIAMYLPMFDMINTIQ